MQLVLKSIALAFNAVFALAVGFLIAGYVRVELANGNAKDVELNWAISMSVGLVVAAILAAPLISILFTSRRWLAALWVAAPLILVLGSSAFSQVDAFLVCLYFLLLVGGAWLTARVLDSR